MAGNLAGGKKAAMKNLARDPDFYKTIGARGGRNGTTGGYASEKIGRDGLTGPERASVIGRKGGKRSKRNHRLVKETPDTLHYVHIDTGEVLIVEKD